MSTKLCRSRSVQVRLQLAVNTLSMYTHTHIHISYEEIVDGRAFIPRCMFCGSAHEEIPRILVKSSPRIPFNDWPAFSAPRKFRGVESEKERKKRQSQSGNREARAGIAAELRKTRVPPL